MYDFCIDKRGIGDESSEGCENNTPVPSQNVSSSKKLDLFDKLPKLATVSKLGKRKECDKNMLDTYVITKNRNKEENDLFPSSVSNILKKSSMKAGLEKEHSVPMYREKLLKLKRQKLREKTKGEKWFNMPATEVTEEVKNDLQVLQMRSVLDKNHFYKKNDIKNIPKYFQFGTVVESAADFYSGRIVKSQRKKTLVDELLADAECKNYQKKKFKEIMDLNRHSRRGQKNKSQKSTKKSKTTVKKNKSK